MNFRLFLEQDLDSWFKGSKIVDKKGQPLVVYHGTRFDFGEFSSEYHGRGHDSGWYGLGFYFSPHPSHASAYAAPFGSNYVDGSRVLPVYLNIKNPFIVYGISGGEIDRQMRKLNILQKGEMWTYSARDLTKRLKQHGYDGVIYKDKGKNDIVEIVAFDPTQIKSIYSKEFNTHSSKIHN